MGTMLHYIIMADGFMSHGIPLNIVQLQNQIARMFKAMKRYYSTSTTTK